MPPRSSAAPASTCTTCRASTTSSTTALGQRLPRPLRQERQGRRLVLPSTRTASISSGWSTSSISRRAASAISARSSLPGWPTISRPSAPRRRSSCSRTSRYGRLSRMGLGHRRCAHKRLALLKRFGSVTVLNGHIHQIMQKVEGNVTFHTARSTAFPQPAPGTAKSPGPMTVPAGAASRPARHHQRRGEAGQQAELAIIDSTLAGVVRLAMKRRIHAHDLPTPPCQTTRRYLGRLQPGCHGHAAAACGRCRQLVKIENFAFAPADTDREGRDHSDLRERRRHSPSGRRRQAARSGPRRLTPATHTPSPSRSLAKLPISAAFIRTCRAPSPLPREGDRRARFGASDDAAVLSGKVPAERFGEVVLPHLADALALARWLTGNAADAEDVVQEACLKAHTGIGTYAGRQRPRVAADDRAQRLVYVAVAQPPTQSRRGRRSRRPRRIVRHAGLWTPRGPTAPRRR